MIRALLVFVFLISIKFSFAQENVREFYSKDGLPAPESKSYYYLVGNKIIVTAAQRKSGWKDTVYVGSVKAYYTRSNKLKSVLRYDKGELQGNFIEYHESGAIKESGVYLDDRKSGNDSTWYANGQVQKVLWYYTVDREYGWKDSKFRIIDYWDISGNQLIKSGNGTCVCLLEEGDSLQEQGKVIDGKKDQLWKAFSGDTLKYEEQYKEGELVKGMSYQKGQAYTYTMIDQMAEMPGGINALLNYLQKNIKYPRDARRLGKEGKVFVKFIVDKEGFIIDAEVVNRIYPSLDQEGLRVVKSLHRWMPGKRRGIPVKSQFILPIAFKLQS